MQDDNGKAYIAYSSERNRVMHVAGLTANFTDVESTYRRTMVSPAVRYGSLTDSLRAVNAPAWQLPYFAEASC